MIGAIVLAAGESRRMGRHKMLLPFGRTTVVGHIIDQLAASAVDEVLVVVGHAGDEVAAALSDRAVRIAVNPNYKSGMLSSVRCGLRALPDQCRAVVVALGDQPSLAKDLVNELVAAFHQTQKGIVVPVYQGRRGHPLLFSMRYHDEVLTQYDDIGLRGLLQGHPEDVLDLDAPTPAVLADMDIPEDYQRELARRDDGN